MKNESVAAAPPAPYMGGKRNLAQCIIERIERTPHELYAEPFLGMGGIFLRRPRRAPVEVANDLSRDVVTLFRMLQRHFVAFTDMLKWQITARADFERLAAAVPDTLTDLERAARFLYLQRTAYSGRITHRIFGTSRFRGARFDVARLVPALEAVHERLSGVVIECLPFAEFIARYDRPGALFYLDPPYWGIENEYGRGLFERADFERLAEILAGIEGRFILSLNDRPQVRRIFAAFRLERVDVAYKVGNADQSKPYSELLISGPRRRRR
jgi:DNA adenine methylase